MFFPQVRVFCGRHPLFAAAMVAVCCVAAADRGWFFGAGVALVCGMAGVFAGSWRRGLAWLLAGMVAVTVVGVRKSEVRRMEAGLVGTGGVFSGRVMKDGKGGEGFWSAPVRLEDGNFKGAKVWWEGTGEAPVAGALVTGRGNFSLLERPRNPAEFDFGGWLRRKGIAAVFESRTVEIRTGKTADFGASIRGGFREAVTAGLGEDSQAAMVIRAIVIGETPPDADELVAAFRNSGTLHIFSVSGMHVAMVGSIAWWVLRRLGLSRRRAVLAMLPLVFGYSWITGNSAPAVRSAWMMAVFLMAFVFRRRPDVLNALGAVLLAAMLWDGNLLFQPGVQMSYGVVAAIALGTAWGKRVFAWIGRKDEYLPDDLVTGWRRWWLDARKWTASYLGVSTAAWVGSTPLTVIHFGLVTPVALISNGVLGFIVFALLTLALISAALHPLAPGAAVLVNQANGKLAELCVESAERFAAIPGSHFHTRIPGEPMLLVYHLEHGAGAACFSGGKEGAVLIDCGDAFGFKSRVVKSLREQGIEPDSVILSHPDGRHLGGGNEVWQAFPVRQALLPVERSRSRDYRKWTNEAPVAGVKILHAAKVESLPLPDDARLEVLHAPDPQAQNVLADDRVAIFRLHWRGWKILLTGDSGEGTERRLLESGMDLSADVIVVGKHRRDISLGADFLNAVNPRVIVASHAEFPKEERLDPKSVDFWKSRGIQVVSQGDAGGVTIRVDKSGDMSIKGYVDQSMIRLKRR